MPELKAIKTRGRLAAALIKPKENPKCRFWAREQSECTPKEKQIKKLVDRAIKRMILKAFIAADAICIAAKNP